VTAPLIIFDVETTGTDPRRDQVIEICVQMGLAADAPARVWRIRPDVDISPGAQAVHGISMDELRDCPRFEAVAGEMRALLAEAEVLVGYNLAFDIDMLQAEYARLGQPPLELSGKQIIDPFRLWQQCEPRTLQEAHRRFVGERFEAAHSASADVAATGRVLEGMLRAFGLPAGDWPVIARVCEPERLRWIGPSRHLQWSEAGRVELAFGKHRGTALADLAAGTDRGFLRWVLDRDFPAHIHDICRRALELSAADLDPWIAATYGPCPAADAAPLPPVTPIPPLVTSPPPAALQPEPTAAVAAAPVPSAPVVAASTPARRRRAAPPPNQGWLFPPAPATN
jgi:DNA polymerase-3 subunit epsilon